VSFLISLSRKLGFVSNDVKCMILDLVVIILEFTVGYLAILVPIVSCNNPFDLVTRAGYLGTAVSEV
jgi:hypothetical protein